MRRWIAAGVGMVLLGGCAGYSRLVSYGPDPAVANYQVQGKKLSAFLHPTEDTIVVTGSVSNAFGKGLLEGITLGIADTAPPFEVWKAGANWLVSPVGCDVVDLHPLDVETSWEFLPRCPEGVDLRSLIEAQREQLRNGAPLQPEPDSQR